MERIGQRHLLSLTFSDHQAVLFCLVFAQITTFEIYFGFGPQVTFQELALLVWRYALILLLAYEVWQVIKNEPTDPIASGVITAQGIDPFKLIFCVLCNKLVFKSSHHCFRCGKCAFDFDHHCKYLNVCIGGSNYIPFLRLLVTFIIYGCLVAGLVLRQEQSALQIGYLAVMAMLIGLVLALLVFHIYLNHCLGMRTIDYLMPGKTEINLAEQVNESEGSDTQRSGV